MYWSFLERRDLTESSSQRMLTRMTSYMARLKTLAQKAYRTCPKVFELPYKERPRRLVLFNLEMRMLQWV